MKKIILLLMSFTLVGQTMAQVTLRIPIVSTGTIEEDGVTISASSDDAEQENDEIDALYDDDIDAGWEGEPEDQNILTAGMRFQNIGINKGSTILSAYIEVYSHEAKTTADVANLTIYAEKTANASTFTEDALITDRVSTDAQVEWIVDEEWGLWTMHTTPDIKDIVQEIIDQDEWSAGNAIAFVVAGENQGPSEVENAREWESFENIADPEDGGDGTNHPERIPVLVVNFTPGNSGKLNIPIVSTGIVTEEDDGEEVTFDASTDDAEQENDEIDALYDDDIDAGWEGEPDDQNILTAGMRFQNVGIPQGATIDSAFIEVYSHESKTAQDVANLTIYAESTDNAETFTEDALITDRTSTTAQIDWIVDVEWGLWTPHRTPDIKEIVQEIVDRSGWNEGNAIAFIVAGENQGPSDVENAREWESFENIADPEDGGDGQNHPERVPRLIIYYGGYEEGNDPGEVLSIDLPVVKSGLYPNPASDETTIVLESIEQASIAVINLNGAIVHQEEVKGQREVNLDIRSYESGLYFVKVIQSGKSETRKLVVR